MLPCSFRVRSVCKLYLLRCQELSNVRNVFQEFTDAYESIQNISSSFLRDESCRDDQAKAINDFMQSILHRWNITSNEFHDIGEHLERLNLMWSDFASLYPQLKDWISEAESAVLLLFNEQAVSFQFFSFAI